MMKSGTPHERKARPPRTVSPGLEIATDLREPPAAPPRPPGAAEIAVDARRQLGSITGLDIDHVSAIEREESGWRVTVDVIELRRIPASTDVLAAYEAILDESGRLMSYHRTQRYFRDQMLEAS